VSAQAETLARIQPGRTRAVLNSDTSPTAEFVRNRDWVLPEQALRTAVEQACGADTIAWVPAQQLAMKCLGDSVFANAIMLGHAWQLGLIPLSLASLERAIALNGQAVAANLRAFRIGRWHAHDRARVERLLVKATNVRWVPRAEAEDFKQTVQHRRALLVGYQSERYASDYEALVNTLCAMPGRPIADALAVAVAGNLYKLMAYKDEYEVARQHTSPAFLTQVQELFSGPYKLAYHLAPPLLSRRNAQGQLQKRRFGPWVRHVFRGLAALKGLRGTPLDVFGWTAERRTERQLITDYVAAMRLVLPHQAEHAKACLELARLPQQIRGYGHVKQASIDRARARQRELLTEILGKAPPAGEAAGYGQFLEGAWS
jgi:indolepyruvate ferredoxin oxidoreductase